MVLQLLVFPNDLLNRLPTTLYSARVLPATAKPPVSPTYEACIYNRQ